MSGGKLVSVYRKALATLGLLTKKNGVYIYMFIYFLQMYQIMKFLKYGNIQLQFLIMRKVAQTVKNLWPWIRKFES